MEQSRVAVQAKPSMGTEVGTLVYSCLGTGCQRLSPIPEPTAAGPPQGKKKEKREKKKMKKGKGGCEKEGGRETAKGKESFRHSCGRYPLHRIVCFPSRGKVDLPSMRVHAGCKAGSDAKKEGTSRAYAFSLSSQFLCPPLFASGPVRLLAAFPISEFQQSSSPW